MLEIPPRHVGAWTRTAAAAWSRRGCVDRRAQRDRSRGPLIGGWSERIGRSNSGASGGGEMRCLVTETGPRRKTGQPSVWVNIFIFSGANISIFNVSSSFYQVFYFLNNLFPPSSRLKCPYFLFVANCLRKILIYISVGWSVMWCFMMHFWWPHCTLSKLCREIKYLLHL